MSFIDLSLRIVDIIFPIFSIVALGYCYGKVRQRSMASINHMIMDIFVPALIFSKLAQSDFNLEEYMPLALSSAGVMLVSGLALIPAVRLTRVQAKTFIPPIMFPNAAK